MNKTEFGKIMLLLGEFYPHFNISSGTARAYYSVFKDYKPDVFEPAIRKAVVTCRFFPTVADIMEHLQELKEKYIYECPDKCEGDPGYETYHPVTMDCHVCGEQRVRINA